MDKADKKKLLNELKEKKIIEFRRGLPMDEIFFPKLFDYVSEQLENRPCLHDLSITSEFCKLNNIEEEKLFGWLKENGGYCDCEIFNAEDLFEYLEPALPIMTKKNGIQKKKITSLQSQGIAVNKIPSPWILFETTENEEKNFHFQLGQKPICTVTVAFNFCSEHFLSDEYCVKQWIETTQLKYNLENIVVERFDIKNFNCTLVKVQAWTPVLIWCNNKQADNLVLVMRTELARHKADLKELNNLLNSIEI